MINEMRTLLANVLPGDPGGEGEELIDPAFAPIDLPSQLSRLRAALFGTNPDRRTVMHRVGSMMALLHRCVLADHVAAEDSRIAYLPTPTGAPFSYGIDPGSAAAALDGFALSYAELPAEDSAGRTLWSWAIADNGDETATISHDGRGEQVEAGDSGAFAAALPGSRIVATWTPATVPTTVLVEYRARPEPIGGRLRRCEVARGADIAWLFEGKSGEPYASYRRLFYAPEPDLERWCAMLLAIARRTREEHVARQSAWLES